MKKWYVSAKKADFNQIGEEFHIDPVIARIIRNRDVITESEIKEFLSSGVDLLHDPALMLGMEEGVELLLSKIKAACKIRIIGDYDIDGISATFILFKGISALGGEVDYDIPDRIKDGYGINENLIKKAFDAGIDTIITCDNGIAAREQIAYAKELGMTVIVTDHHEVPFEIDEMGIKKELLPPADVVIDPHQAGCNYPFKGLCGALVAYKFLWRMYQITNKPLTDLYELLDIAAIATIGDVMDLRGENRNIVKLGLAKLRKTRNLGLNCLIDVNNLEKESISSYHIGFVIGPCINAGGRLDTAKKALRLLLSNDEDEARDLARELYDFNARRKDMTVAGVEAAIEQIEGSDLINDKVLVVYLPDCHESLVGIVAGRIRERYYKPVFVLSDGDGLVKGSGRSIEEYNMFEKMIEIGDVFLKFGGHAMAAGLSLEETRIEEFRRRINDNCELTSDDLTEKLSIDVPMPISYIRDSLIEQFEVLEPFGKGNPKPLFAQKDVNVLEARLIGKNKNVLKLKLMDSSSGIMEGISFNRADEFKEFILSRFGESETKRLFQSRSNKVKINIAYYPGFNEFNGSKTIQINILDFC